MRDSARITTEVFKTLAGGTAGGVSLLIMQEGNSIANSIELFLLFGATAVGFVLMEVVTGYEPE